MTRRASFGRTGRRGSQSHRRPHAARRDDESFASFVRRETIERVLSVGRYSKPLWWYPTWSLLAGLVFGVAIARFADVDGGSLAFLVYDGDPEAARSFVSLVATSVATITSLTLTITVVTLQLASSQYSPRLIEHYLDDRGTRGVISLFLLTFAFAVATLLNVRLDGPAGEANGQVPGPAISLLVVLVVASLGGLVFFVHRVTESIRVESILKRVRDRTLSAIADRTAHDEAREAADEAPDPDDASRIITSRRTGFYVDLDREALADCQPPHGTRVWIVVAPGDFVTVDSPVAFVSGWEGDDVTDTVESWMRFDSERWIEADYSYGVRSLMDVAVKALSPGINDPTTAVMAVQRIAEVMAAAAASHPDRVVPLGDAGRVYVTIRPWAHTMGDVVRQIALYGRSDLDVVRSVIDMLWALSWMTTGVDRSAEIRSIARRFRELVEVERTESGQRILDDEFERLEARLEGDPTVRYRSRSGGGGMDLG